ncbi:MAG TPA: hypothetical protein VM533_05230 [Fimbriiglobus sp.]|nr:hypothetical protein [Fimbriiglobus sp.]
MAPSPRTLPVVDFLEQPLSEGDRIAFNNGNDGRLYAGSIRMVERDAYQLVVHSGHLLIIEGDLLRANGGKPERIRFNQVVRLPSEDGA